MSLDDQTVMERLDYDNDERTRKKILSERRSALVSVYNDVVRVMEVDDCEENRRNRRIETFNDIVTFINRWI